MSHFRDEINFIYGAACDALRVETRHRALTRLIAESSSQKNLQFGLYEEREIQLAATLAMNWRHIGLHTELDSYPSGKASRRPDFGIWLPVSAQYFFLELKVIWPGSNTNQAIDDIAKIDEMYESGDKAVGLLTVGYALPNMYLKTFDDRHRDMSIEILGTTRYEEIGMKKIELGDIDSNIIYAWVGMWVHKNDFIRSPK